MYEELIQVLQLHCEAGKKIGLNGKIWTLLGDASTALEALTAQLAALQAENAEKDGEITKLKLEKELMRQEWDESQAALSRVEAERGAAIARINKAYEIAWGCDIPSPTVPEYVELHGGMTRVMTALRGAQGEG